MGRREQGEQKGKSLHRQSSKLSPHPHLPPSPLTNFADWASWQRQSSLAQQLLAEDPRRQLILTSQLFGDEAIQGPWLLVLWSAAPLQQAVV